MWRSVGKMADKERAMVEERIKRTGAAPGSTFSKGTPTPARAMGGAKIVVPPSAVRRPNSRGPLSRREESGSRTRDNSPERPGFFINLFLTLNGTFTQEERGRGDRLNSTITMANTSRYVVDDDVGYVEQTGVHALPSTQMLADIDTYQPRLPSISRPPTSTPMRYVYPVLFNFVYNILLNRSLSSINYYFSTLFIVVSSQILIQVQYLLSVEEQRSLLDERLNLLMRALAMQMNLIRSLHRLDTAKGQELLKLVLNFLTPLTSSADKTARMSINEDTVFEILWEMVHVLHSTLSDARCSSLPDSATIGRSLNTLIIRVCVRSEPSVFFAACSRCLATGLLENPDGEPVQLFMKCMYKWDDTMKKTPTRFNLDLFMRAANHFFEQIQPLSMENPDSVYPESLRSVEMCTEKAIVIMGPGVVDAMNRLARPHKHLLSYVNMCYKSYEDMHPGWAPLLPGTVNILIFRVLLFQLYSSLLYFLPILSYLQVPDESVTHHKPMTGVRSELQIMVDNVVRDLSSYQKHVSLLANYMEKHPQNNMKYEDYLKAVSFRIYTIYITLNCLYSLII
uniref:Neurobeachin n=1 Tax=Heterorhabditis bacteriophora TaxID=37862 RepID=A0A1I7XPT1_HETBA